MNLTKLLRANFPDIKPDHVMLTLDGCSIGRATDCTIVVARPFASRLHARIAFDGHYFVVTDNDSANGTFVNGRQLAGPHKLKHGDQIGLGDPTGLLVYLDEDKTLQPLARLRFDSKAWRFAWDDAALALSSDQLSLLLHLYDRRGEICSRTDCAKAIWGHDYDSSMDADALDQVISRLRARLRATSKSADELLVTVRGQGYQLKRE